MAVMKVVGDSIEIQLVHAALLRCRLNARRILRVGRLCKGCVCLCMHMCPITIPDLTILRVVGSPITTKHDLASGACVELIGARNCRVMIG